MLVVVVILAFFAGASLALGLAQPSARRSAVARRLEQFARPGPEATPAMVTEEDVSLMDRAVRPLLRRLATVVGRTAARGTVPATRLLLERAGHPGGWGVVEYQGLRVLAVAASLALIALSLHSLNATTPLKAVFAVLELVIGLTLPEAWLQGKVRERQAAVRKSLPDTLDLLVVSVEAGVGFDGAVAQVVQKQPGPLADELRRALQEMRLGRTRAEALKDMATRLDVPEVTRFVAAVTQTDRLGTGLSEVLRVQSETARTQRMQHIRQAAARLPTKMLFPLIFFLFPALFVVVLGPGLINLLRALGPH